jgi:hypothetical protein
MTCAPRRSSLVLFGISTVFLAASAPAGAATVTSLADSGPGTLREAIELANSDGIPTTIDFAGGLAGAVISPLSQLPDLTANGTTIDGDLGADCVPDIGIDGSGAGAGAVGLALASDGHTISGLAIYDFGDSGLQVEGSGNVVECNYIGTDLALAGGHGNGNNSWVAGSDNRFGPGNVVVSWGVGIQVAELTSAGYPLFASMTPDDTRVYRWGDFSPFQDTFLYPDRCVWKNLDGVVPTDGGGAPFASNFGLRLTGQVDLGAGGDYTFEVLPYDFRRLLVDGIVVIDFSGPEPPSAVVTGLAPGAHTIELDLRKDGGRAAIDLAVTGPGSVSFSTGGSPPAGCGPNLQGLCGELFRLRIPSERNRITQSSIHDSGPGTSSGISLSFFCNPLDNDAGDLDVGPNTALNHPDITTTVYSGTPGTYIISGTAPPDSTVELFRSYGTPGGFGQGEAYLASTLASPAGTFSTSVTLGFETSVLTASATDPAGNTSELAPNYAPNVGQDGATVSSAPSAFPGQSFVVPVYARDVSLTPLGVDRPAGERIQSLSYKVTFTPASSIASKLFARAGITAGLTPIFQSTPTTATTASYLGTFDETTNPIPFTLDAAAPGDQVLQINVTLAAAAPAGTIALTLDPTATLFANQAGSLEETPANGWLALADGQITVLSNAAAGLYAVAISSSAIQLTWADPNANETGFRLERSLDGASWSTAATLGPDVTSHLDATGLSPATLYYYRLVTLVPADSQSSNVAAASTFPAAAAKTCATQLSLNREWARYPFAAWNGSSWGVVWQERSGGDLDEIYFQRFASTTLAPIGTPVNVSRSAPMSQYPAIAWNGSQFGVAWYEHQRTEPGQLPAPIAYFALLNADGSVARRGVRIDALAQFNFIGINTHPVLEWDGTNWGFFSAEGTAEPFTEVVYRRLAPNGDLVLGPVSLTSTPGHFENEIDAAFSPALSEYGVAWIRYVDTTFDVYFQRVEESTGAPLGSPALLGSFSDLDGTWGLTATWNPAVPPGGAWAVAWAENDSGAFTDVPTFLRLVDPSGTPLGTGPERLSNDADVNDPAYDILPQVKGLSAGDFVVATMSYSYLGSGSYEIARLTADASGVRTGSRTFLTVDDGRHSSWPRLASDGDRYVVVWNDAGPGTAEVAGQVVDALGVPGPEVPLTSSHSPGNPVNFFGAGNPQVAPLGAGFVALWSDAVSGTNLTYARTFDGSGATIANLLPLTSNPTGNAALAAAGDTFAVAYRNGASGLVFARYDAAGSPVVGETVVASGVGGGLAMAFSGEVYGVVSQGGGPLRFQAVAPDGTPVGPLRFPVASGVGSPAPRLRWTGDGWAVLYRGNDQNLHYVFLDPDGSLLHGPTTLTPPPFAPSYRTQFDLAFAGGVLGVAWNDYQGGNPPGADIYFAVIQRDGSSAVPAFPAVSGPFGDSQARLYWAGGTFHLVHSYGFRPGLREIEIQPDGTVLPGERYWSNREGGVSVAWNGAALGIGWAQLRELFFETSACVEDATPPPCPTLSVSSLANEVRLSWSAVTDPDSAIWRYDVYRDSWLMSELLGTTLAWDDAGYRAGTTHTYEVRAMNGAFQESEGCPVLSFSTLAGDANGNGTLDVADIFYLINFFFADGPPPLGDADANGDGGVTVTDIFYLINYFFSGGPPPVWLPEADARIGGGVR